MYDKIYRKIADFEQERSIARKIRSERIKFFNDLISDLSKPLKILDVGGTEVFWEIMGFAGDTNYEITILNLSKEKTKHWNIISIKGDARNMKEFKDKEFDVVFSNSVIEHVGDYKNQEKMANEF